MAYKDYKKVWRQRHPIKAAYQTLRHNARRRGIPFEISFEYFQKFCFKTRLLNYRGKKPESYSVDRINAEFGYIPGNIQVLTLSDNGYKGYLEKIIYYEEGTGLKCRSLKKDNENYPF